MLALAEVMHEIVAPDRLAGGSSILEKENILAANCSTTRRESIPPQIIGDSSTGACGSSNHGIVAAFGVFPHIARVANKKILHASASKIVGADQDIVTAF